MDPTQQLLDIEAIKQLKARYCRFVDAGDWASLRTLFTDDAQVEIWAGVRHDSPDVWVESLLTRTSQLRLVTVHQVTNPEIEITSPTTARGIWAVHDYADSVPKEGGERSAFDGYGYYHETYRKTDAGWQFASTRMTRLRVDLLDPATMPPFPGEPAETPSFS